MRGNFTFYLQKSKSLKSPTPPQIQSLPWLVQPQPPDCCTPMRWLLWWWRRWPGRQSKKCPGGWKWLECVGQALNMTVSLCSVRISWMGLSNHQQTFPVKILKPSMSSNQAESSQPRPKPVLWLPPTKTPDHILSRRRHMGWEVHGGHAL